VTRPNPRSPGGDKPPRVRSVTRHEVEGRLPYRMHMPEAYIGNPGISFDWGPIHLSLLDEGAMSSLIDAVDQLRELRDRAYPDLDRALRDQRLARQRTLEREQRLSEDRHFLNGGPTALERKMIQAQADAEFGEMSQ
jgi:hypothetical protein